MPSSGNQDPTAVGATLFAASAALPFGTQAAAMALTAVLIGRVSLNMPRSAR